MNGYFKTRCSLLAFLASLILLVAGCTSTQTAAYHYTQKQIEHQDLTFHKSIRVDEYINAFAQDEIKVPENQDMVLKIDPFTPYQPMDSTRTLIQIAVKTRRLNKDEAKAPVGICIVFDTSGSMGADNKMTDAKQALQKAIAELRDGDELALVTFDTEAKTLISPTIISQQTRAKITELVKDISAQGSTDIEAGLVQGYTQMARFKTGHYKRLLLITDGQSNVGTKTPEQIAQKAAVEYLDGARISTIGLGIEVDANLLRMIAKNSKGHYYFAENARALTTILRDELRTTVITIAQNVHLDMTLQSGFHLKALYGQNSPIDPQSKTISIDLGELNADDWRILVAEIEGDISAGSYTPLSAKVSFNSKNSEQTQFLTANTHIHWHMPDSEMTSESINPNVARNSILFGNATCLVKVGQLCENQEYDQALRILDLQINNNKIMEHMDDTGSMQKELSSLGKVRNILVKQGANPMPFMRVDTEELTADSSPLKKMVLLGLDIASQSLPGIWGTVAKLFIVLIK